MNVLFQCLGITGAILIFYGLIAFAVTQVSTWFFWTLLVAGVSLLITFIMTALSRAWQLMIALAVVLNVPWILLLVGKDWPIWVSGLSCLPPLAIFFWLAKRYVGTKWSGILTAVVAIPFGVLAYFHEVTWFGYGVTGTVLLYNGIFIYLGRLFLKEMFRDRSVQYGASAAIYTTVVLGIIALVNVASQDLNREFDFTQEKINTLSDQSVKLLNNLGTNLKITAFFDERNQAKPMLKDLLGKYEYKSKKVDVAFVDPDKDKLLAEKHQAKDGDILFEYEAQTHVAREVNEQAITQAILKVSRDTTPTVCFTQGHGELDIDAEDEEPRSLSAAKGGLENEGYEPKGIENLIDGVPAECNTLVVAGPTQKFTKAEADNIDRFLKGGGKALILLDPEVGDPRLSKGPARIKSTGLENLTSAWGVKVGRNMILEKHLSLFEGMKVDLSVRANTYGDQPIVDPLKGRQTVFDRVRSVEKKGAFDGTAIEIVKSGGKGMSWGEADVAGMFKTGQAAYGSGDVEGPVSFGVAVEKEVEEARQAKLVVVGDSDFVSNAMIRSYEFNYDFFLNSLNWLSGEVEQISIRPKKLAASAMELTPHQSHLIFYVAIITLPMLVLIFGLDLWWYRRRRG